MSLDLTFITNEKEATLLDRFKTLIKDTKYFDVLVGYFYITGFNQLYESLNTTEKIRILVGMNTNKATYDLVKSANLFNQTIVKPSEAECKEMIQEDILNELENSDDTIEIETGVRVFRDWLINNKLEVRIYPDENIHAKVYIMTFDVSDRDKGRVITGSSNFTKGGLIDNIEFNVELKNKSDYTFAINKFNELWEKSIDLKEVIANTIDKSWINQEITPYELFLKLLYEYFKEKINIDIDSNSKDYFPPEFKQLDYQIEAVKDAKNKLEQYGGVFLADVVGLGKTYISALLAKELDGRHLVIAPPLLLDENNPGSWKNVFSDFKVPADFVSVGKLDSILLRGTEKYKNIFIDEAHRFRNETNMTYEEISRICRGKRIILVSATPLNNDPSDILSQIKLFQKSRNSTIPNVRDLEKFFNDLKKNLNGLDRKENYKEYMKVVRANANQVRDKILKYLMVRRTRNEIVKYFDKDLKEQGLKFPEVDDPKPIYYQLNPVEDRIFNKTIELITKDFSYSRYTPMLFLKAGISQPEELSQMNMRKFMKILLVKRLESSFFAFKMSVKRFIKSYEHFIAEFNKGNVYVSKKYSNKVFELLQAGDLEALDKLINAEKVHVFNSKDFSPEFINKLNDDLEVLKKIDEMWSNIQRDPKLLRFIEILISDNILKNNKLIVFTESKETVDYLKEELTKNNFKGVISFSGDSANNTRDTIIKNFDANVRSENQKDDYRILLTTEVLSEGINLHRSCVVINYDIPWNPTRMMQRAGRINRVNTKFDRIFTYNFFPTVQSDSEIGLKSAAEAKIQSFIEMLGADSKLLTDGEEITSHELFRLLNSKKTITGEDNEESELKYLMLIRNIRDSHSDLFEKIKQLPKKARSARKFNLPDNSLVSFFRKGKLTKFFISSKNDSNELDFLQAVKYFECSPDTPREKDCPDYFDLLNKNKNNFIFSTTEEIRQLKQRSGRDSSNKILQILNLPEVKYCKIYTDEDDLFIKNVKALLNEGALPKQTTKTLASDLNKVIQTKPFEPIRVISLLRNHIPDEFFIDTFAESAADIGGKREVILSEYLVNEDCQ